MKKRIAIIFSVLICFTLFSLTANATEPVFTDNLDDLKYTYESSDGWQVDKTIRTIGSMLNKNANNDIQYITYKCDDLKSFKLYVTSFISDISIPKADVCAYVSSDNVEWTQIKVAFVKPKTVAQGWRLFEAVPTKVLPEGTKYIKFELQVLNIEDLGNCFVTGFQKVELFTEIDDSMNINTADDENEDAVNDENNETNSDNSSNLADSNFNNANKGISITTLYIFLGVAFVVMIASCVVTSTIINKKNK